MSELSNYFGRPVGIFSWVYSQEAQRIAEGAVKDGFSCVQWSTTEPTEAAAKEAQSVFSDVGLEVVALSGYKNLVHPDVPHSEWGYDQIERYLDLCPFFPKCTGVATETGTRNAENEWRFHADNLKPETWEAMLTALKRLGKRAESVGSKVLIEGYVEHIVRTAADITRVKAELDMEHFAFVMDPFNLILEEALPTQAEEIERVFQAMGTHAPIAHAKDLLYNDGVVDTPRSGTGIFDFQAYFHYLDTQLPGVPLVLEHLEAHEVQPTLDFLKRQYEQYKTQASS